MNRGMVAEQVLLVLLSFLPKAFYHFRICQADLWPQAASCCVCEHKQDGMPKN